MVAGKIGLVVIYTNCDNSKYIEASEDRIISKEYKFEIEHICEIDFFPFNNAIVIDSLVRGAYVKYEPTYEFLEELCDLYYGINDHIIFGTYYYALNNETAHSFWDANKDSEVATRVMAYVLGQKND